MNRARTLTIFFICFLFLGGVDHARAQIIPFSFESNTGGKNHDVLSAAKIMYNEFSKKQPESNIDATKIMGQLKNPFKIQLPIPVVKNAPEPAEKAPEPEKSTPIEAPPPTVTLAGIVWNTDKPQAIINNEIMNIGDSIGGWVITDISQKGVSIKSMDGTKHLLKL